MKEMYVMMMMIIFPAKQLCIAKSLNLKQYGLLFVEFTEILWTFHNKKILRVNLSSVHPLLWYVTNKGDNYCSPFSSLEYLPWYVHAWWFLFSVPLSDCKLIEHLLPLLSQFVKNTHTHTKCGQFISLSMFVLHSILIIP